MSYCKKEEVKRDLCKIHTARSERELYKVCPSKLSRKELEDLYFTLLGRNLELKKTVTAQQDQIKVLSTRLQRMTATQKSNVAREKNCCAHTKAMVMDQKEQIADLQRVNEKLSERIRVLSMRLCSAKQFLRRSPADSSSRCTKCSVPPSSLKNSSVSVLHPKKSVGAMKPGASTQSLDKETVLTTRTVETETEEPEKENTERLCNENRCRTLMEELKQKIVDLQEELSKTHAEYSERISRLETEVLDLRVANDRERTERASSDHQLSVRAQQADQLSARLRDAEAKYGELSAELAVERRRVAELEARVKAAGRAAAVAKTIQEHFDNVNQQANEEAKNQQPERAESPAFSPQRNKASSPVLEAPTTPYQEPCTPTSEGTDKPCCSDKDESSEKGEQKRASNDSGYIDAYKSPKDERVPKITVSETKNEKITCVITASPVQFAESPDKLGSEIDAFAGSCQRRIYNRSGFLEAYSSPKENDKAVMVNDETNDDLKNRITHLQEQMNQLLMAIKTDTLNEKAVTATKRDDKKPSISKSISNISPERYEPSFNESNFADTLKRTLDPNAATDSTPARAELTTLLDSDKQQAAETPAQGNIDVIHSDYGVNVGVIVDDAERDRPNQAKNPQLKTNNDAHNKYQIPGPMPVDFKNSETPPSKINKQNCVKYKIPSKIPGKAREPCSKVTSFGAINYGGETPLRIRDDDDETLSQAEADRETKVRISIDRPAEATSSKTPQKVGSLTEKFIDNELDLDVPAMSSATLIPTIPEKQIDAPQDNNALELCLQHTRVCTCSGARRRDVSVFRTCSGTLRFRTAPVAPNSPAFKRCRCTASQPYDSARCSNVGPYKVPTKFVDKATQTDNMELTGEFRRRSATYSKGPAHPASHSPDNTDREISTMTDLPSERDDKSPRELLSPGETKQTTTYSSSYSPDTTEYGNLSEGELPRVGVQQLSDGEAKMEAQENKLSAPEALEQQSKRMQDALAAINDELDLCRGMLQARRSEPTRNASEEACLVDLSPGPIALKKASGSPQIGDAFTPKCIFTLHIGTVVLSDEAVINSRDMNLVLTWKFYDQSATMTRMRAGRVVLFDFSTEYDVKLTDEFLNYLKHERMELVISEMGKQDEPFATCALPLRDAVLHTNRRADMSLALIAGPMMRTTHDALDSGDEVGVLDLWCMLHVDPVLLPAISRAIARQNVAAPSKPAYIDRVVEEDRLNEEQLSQDLDMRTSLKDAPGAPDPEPSYPRHSQDLKSRKSISMKERAQLYDFDLDVKKSSHKVHKGTADIKPFPNSKQEERSRKSMSMRQRSELYDLRSPERDRRIFGNQEQSIADVKNIQPAPVRRSIASQISTQLDKTCDIGHPSKMSLMRSQVGFKDAKVQSIQSVIANEVPANIKSVSEMKQALARYTIQENNTPGVHLSKLQNDAESQAQSTANSLRGLVTRRQIPKCSKRNSYSKMECSLTSLLKKDRSTNVRPTQSADCQDGSMELFKGYRTQNGSKKSVTIAKYFDKNRDKDDSSSFQKLPENDHEPSVEQVQAEYIEITIVWLALNEECDAMVNPNVQRLYVAYSFLGRGGADLETPVSLPKPKNYVDKCFFRFTKKFQLNDCDLPILGHMARCRAADKTEHNSKDCVVFTVISEPPEDPLGLDNCEDIGHAYLYFGDVLAYSAGSDSYTEVVPVQSAQAGEGVCGVLAVRVIGLDVLRRSAMLSQSEGDLAYNVY